MVATPETLTGLSKLRVLVVHNRYQQSGGEDGVVREETTLLKSRGHRVLVIEEDNSAIATWAEAVKTALRCVYSWKSQRILRQAIQEFQPDVVHIHNFFPRISPSVHYLCRRKNIPAVQTLHNYRLFCPGATFFRNERSCEDCKNKLFAWPALRNRCYRDNFLATAAVVLMNFVHRLLKTWGRTVTRYITLTEFARLQFVSAGLPSDRLSVKPNFSMVDPGRGDGRGGYALYVGRLSKEKGVQTLIDGWRQLSASYPLKIVGDGPLMDTVARAAGSMEGLEYLGGRSHSGTLELMREAAFLVIPSICYEGFPLVAAEALSAGLPIVGSRIGSIAEIVRDGDTGRLFPPGDATSLATQVEWCFTHPDQLMPMRERARADYESKYAPTHNYRMLMDIYKLAIKSTSQNTMPAVLSTVQSVVQPTNIEGSCSTPL